MDEQGRIKIFKWKINILDLFVLLLIVSILPIFVVGYKVFARKAPTTIDIYKISRSCPNCGVANLIEVELGKPKPTFSKGICRYCANDVVFLKPRIIPPKIPDYLQLYFKILYEELQAQ